MNFVTQIQTLLVNGTLTRQQADAIAKSEGITDKTVQKELTELAIVLTAREIALQPLPLQARFSQIVALYKGQVNLAHRTSQSIMLQQYSTPAPIAFMAGEYVKHELSENYQILEPSAGNGLLTIVFPSKNVLVNEIDELRNQNLQGQGYMKVMRVDGTTNLARLYELESLFDGIVTNPPFGTMDMPLIVGEYKINHLDHVMCIRALDCMRDNGRAAMIIGGHTSYDAKGRVQAGKNRIFLTYLYSHYNVEDIINIDGSLYSRQGTSFNVRLILINGRKAKPQGYPPLKTDDANPITDFESLYERVTGLFGEVKAEQLERQSTSFHNVNEGDYVEIYTGTINKQKVAEGKVGFKYGKHYLKLDNDNATRYNYGYTYYVVEPTTDKPKSEPFDVKEPDGFFYNGLIYVLDESGNYFPIGTSQKSIRNAIHRSRMWQHIHNKLATHWYKNDDKPKRLRIAKAKAKALLLLQEQSETLGNINMIPKISKNIIVYKDEKDLKEKVTEFVRKSNYVGLRFEKQINGRVLNLELTWQGLKNDINEYHPNYTEKLLSFVELPLLIKNAQYILTENDKRKRVDVKAVHKFFSKVIVGNTEFDVIIIVYETSKTYLYDHILVK